MAILAKIEYLAKMTNLANIRQSLIKKSNEMAKGSFKIGENSTNGKLLPRFANVTMRGQIVPKVRYDHGSPLRVAILTETAKLAKTVKMANICQSVSNILKRDDKGTL